jgi:hypothetical protein
MFGKNWLRNSSGMCLIIATICVVVQSMRNYEFSNKLYYGTSLVAVFGYLFLSSRDKEQKSDSPWWW